MKIIEKSYVDKKAHTPRDARTRKFAIAIFVEQQQKPGPRTTHHTVCRTKLN